MNLIFSLVSWVVFGLIVGAIARLIMPGKQLMNWPMTMLLGIVGSFLGGAISYGLFDSGTGYVQPAGWIMSIVGAFIALAAYSFMQTKKAAKP
jgi:uncharacterized membrane protein YeaQ/YmgE (transglycosylase-associated protein family)